MRASKLVVAMVTCALLPLACPLASAAAHPSPARGGEVLVTRYLSALERGAYGDAFALLTASARRYYHSPANLRSVYAADAYRLHAFRLVGAAAGATGEVYYARESATFRDHAHDLDMRVTATVPIGVVRDAGAWRIKDPGHPWRAFASTAAAEANGVRISVRKVSFFDRRIETVVRFVNAAPVFVTVLPYGRSVLRDAAGRPYRVERDWAFTDRTLFTGLRLAPGARYTGALYFGTDAGRAASPTYSLTIAPLLLDGADAPFSIEIGAIADRDATAGS